MRVTLRALASIHAIAGMLLVLMGFLALATIVRHPGWFSTGSWWLASLYWLIAVPFLATAVALWRSLPWSRWACVAVTVIQLVAMVWVLAPAAHVGWQIWLERGPGGLVEQNSADVWRFLFRLFGAQVGLLLVSVLATWCAFRQVWRKDKG